MADTSKLAASGPHVRCVVVTPEETVVDREADFVALPLFDGELGVALNHAPMIGRLGFGELRVKAGAAEESFYVDGGFVQVADNVVSVLTNRSLPAKKLDPASLEKALQEAGNKLAAGDDQIARRDRQISQVRAQLRVAQRSGSQR